MQDPKPLYNYSAGEKHVVLLTNQKDYVHIAHFSRRMFVWPFSLSVRRMADDRGRMADDRGRMADDGRGMTDDRKGLVAV